MDQKRMKTCPFNASHVVEERRYLVHIERCKKSTSNFHEFAQCRFNATHYAKRDEIENHEESCPNRVMIDKSAFEGEPIFELTELVDNTENLTLEDWDHTTSTTTFSPENQLAMAPYMTVPQGLSKAERKTHWLKERERLQELEKTRAAEKQQSNTMEIAKPKEKVVTRMPTSRIAARFFGVPDIVRNQESASIMSDRHSSEPSPIGRGRGLIGVYNLLRDK